MEKANSKHVKRVCFLLFSFISVLILICYYNSLHVPFIYDDQGKIVDNPDIKDLSNLPDKLVYPYNTKHKTFFRNAPTRPVVFFTLALNYYFNKLDPFGYHLVNVLVHIGVVLLVFFLARKISSFERANYRIAFPFLVAFFFAVHTVQTGSVTYIYKRTELIAAFFYFSSLILFTKCFESSNKRRILYYIGALLSFILALGSKEHVVTLPFLILCIDYLFISKRNLTVMKQRKYYHIPFWSILILYLLAKYFYLGGIGDVEGTSNFSNYEYFLNQPYVILRYVQLLLVPSNMSIVHDISPVKTAASIRFLLPCFVIILTGLIIGILSRVIPHLKTVIIFPSAFFMTTLLPTSSFFTTTTLMEDNRLYLPLFGFCLLISFVYCSKLFSYTNHEGSLKLRKLILLVLSIHITLLCFGTYQRNKLFANPELLWENAIQQYPHNSETYNNLGVLHIQKKDYDAAFKVFSRAVAFNGLNAEAQNNLGALYFQRKNDYQSAFFHLKKAIEINPHYAGAYNNIGSVYERMNQYQQALESFKIAVAIAPAPSYYYNLGKMYALMKQNRESIDAYSKAIVLDQNFIAAHYELGKIYYSINELQASLSEFRRVIELDPHNDDTKQRIKEIVQKISSKNN